MSNENKTIHEFELNLICDFFSNMERQGPGSPEVTLKALSFIDNLTDKSLIADIGCGTGGQTMVLAEHTPGQITGLDFLSDFIHIFNELGWSLGDMDTMINMYEQKKIYELGEKIRGWFRELLEP